MSGCVDDRPAAWPSMHCEDEITARVADVGLAVASVVTNALGWRGAVLPALSMSAGAVMPVVRWSSRLGERLAEHPAPVLSRPILAAWEIAGPPSALSIVGFVHVGPPAAGLDRLRPLGGYGSGLIIVGAGGVGRWALAEADVAGIWVARCRQGGSTAEATVEALVTGRVGPVVSARRTTGTRLREEQLYDWAVRCGRASNSVSPGVASAGREQPTMAREHALAQVGRETAVG